MEYGTTCFFICHRDAGECVLPALMQAVERLINDCGVTDFVVGHYGRFDSLAARVVKEAKQRYPEVTLTMLLPYHPFDRPIPVPKGYDSTFYPPGMEHVPKRYAIVRANRYMVEHSGYLIAYTCHAASNSRELVEYALRREKKGLIHVQNIADEVNEENRPETAAKDTQFRMCPFPSCQHMVQCIISGDPT